MRFDQLPQPTITTARLLLRPMKESDAPDVVRWRNAPHVRSMSRSQDEFTEEGHLRWFRTTREHRVDYVLVERDTGRGIGSFALQWREDTPVGAAAESSRYIGEPDALRQGYAAEALGAWLRLAFDFWLVPRIIGWTRTDNAANIALNERFGYWREGEQDGYLLMVLTAPPR